MNLLPIHQTLADRHPLTLVCKHHDVKKTGGLSPINPDVIKVVLDSKHWDYVDQIIKLYKTLVDENW